MPPCFNIPLDLPHAGTVAHRIVQQLERRGALAKPENSKLKALTVTLQQMLAIYREDGENPVKKKAYRVRDNAASLARQVVDEIERLGLGEDRLGQCVRNLFECLELGEEGAAISLRAGENPRSPQRPV